MEFGKCQSVMVGTFQLVRQQNFHINHPKNSSFVVEEERGDMAVWPSHVSSVAELSPILNGKSG